MYQIRLLWILTALVSQGNLGSRTDLSSESVAPGEMAQGKAPVSVRPARPPVTTTVRGRFFGRLRRFSQTPDAQDAASATKSAIRNAGQDQSRYQSAGLGPATMIAVEPKVNTTRRDDPVRRVQATSSDMNAPHRTGYEPIATGD